MLATPVPPLGAAEELAMTMLGVVSLCVGAEPSASMSDDEKILAPVLAVWGTKSAHTAAGAALGKVLAVAARCIDEAAGLSFESGRLRMAAALAAVRCAGNRLHRVRSDDKPEDFAELEELAAWFVRAGYPRPAARS